MANKQPFYHRVDGLLFTMHSEISEKQFIEALEKSLAGIKHEINFGPEDGGLKFIKAGFEKGSIEIEAWGGGEPGDPADLM